MTSRIRSGLAATGAAALVLTAGVAVSSPSSATAPAETCRGQVVTILAPATGTVSGTEGDDVISTRGASINALGGDDVLCVGSFPEGFEIDLGSGDDLLHNESLAQVQNADFRGGTGRDLMETYGDIALYDVPAGRLTQVRREGVINFSGFEDHFVQGKSIQFTGTEGADGITVASCTPRVSGRGGPDTIRVTYYTDNFMDYCGGYYRPVVVAGSGRDRIEGGPGKGRLFGNRGYDYIYGGAGRDLCVAERTKACERR